MVNSSEVPVFAKAFDLLWRRFSASIFDLFFLAPLWFINFVLFNVDIPNIVLVCWFTFFVFSYPLYSVVMHWIRGQTVGKKLSGIMVVSIDGSSLNLWQALRRDSILIAVLAIAYVITLPQLLTYHVPFGPDQYPINDVNRDGYDFVINTIIWWNILEFVTPLFFSMRLRSIHDWLAQTASTWSAKPNRKYIYLAGGSLFVLWLITAGIVQNLKTPPLVSDIAQMKVQLIPQTSVQTAELEKGVEFEWAVEPTPHGRVFVNAYMAADPNFENEISWSRTLYPLWNFGGKFKKSSTYKWVLFLDEEERVLPPEQVYIRVRLSTRDDKQEVWSDVQQYRLVDN